MTLAQAEANRDAQNTQIGEGVATAKMYVFPFWDLSEFTKQYDTVLLPFIYDAQIAAATDSQLLAFKRVSNNTFGVGGFSDLAGFVATFQTEAVKDTELATYLGL